MGSISYLSKIHGFCGTHETRANYAPVAHLGGIRAAGKYFQAKDKVLPSNIVMLLVHIGAARETKP